MTVIKKYGEIFVDRPNKQLIKEMREVADKEAEMNLGNKETNNLYEVYYYLKTGNYSGAWRKINSLKDDIRFKIPETVYNELKETCKEMDITIA
jgi:phosphopantetheine adenylyltransferase